MSYFQLCVLTFVVALAGMGISQKLERIARAIEAKLKEKNT